MKIKLISLIGCLLFIILMVSPIITQTINAACNDISNGKTKRNNKIFSIFDFIKKMKPGDIIIHLPGKEGQYGHCRLFTGFEALNNKYSFVDSYFHVLGYSRSKLRVATLFLVLTYFWGYDGLALIRVNATQQQKQNAIDFANLQVGKRFDFCRKGVDKKFNPENPEVKSANQWYCSELPWAAYYNCNNSFPKVKPINGYIYGEGIDIDANGWEKDHEASDGILHSLVYPLDIINDDDCILIDTWMK